jgi:transposase-like protein
LSGLYKQFNEWSSGLLSRTQFPSDVIALVVLWLRYKLSLRELAEMFLIRGFVFTYEAVRDWEAKLRPALAEELRRSRKGKVGRSWYADETYVRMHGHWKYLYRAIDRDGAVVDVTLSEHRNLAPAQPFFRSAKAVTFLIPDRVTTDAHSAYRRAIRTESRQPRAASDKRLSQQSPRAGSSWHQGPMPADARLQERHVSNTILPWPRRTP